jgi:carotenoid 1,2-hydratase
MTERGREKVRRDATELQIGPSLISWQEDDLVIDIDEWTAPLPRRLKGSVRLTPGALPCRSFDLDAQGRHRWQPIAPQSRIQVALDRPDLRWSGSGYLDSNHGDEPLEDGFVDWSWSRAHRQQDTVVLYDAKRRDGSDGSLALRFDMEGGVESLTPPPAVTLPPTLWRVARPSRAHGAPHLRQTLEDAPFYSRNLLETPLYGEMATAFHESLDLGRFRHPLVKLMLPFRMPRALF